MLTYRLSFLTWVAIILVGGCAVANEPIVIDVTRPMEETAVFTSTPLFAPTEINPTLYVTPPPTFGTPPRQFVTPASRTPIPPTSTAFIRPTQATTPIPLLTSPTENNPTAVWLCYFCESENGTTILVALENGQIEQRTLPVEIGRFWGYRPTSGYFLYSSQSDNYDIYSDLWAYHVTTQQTIHILTSPHYTAQLSPDGITIAILKEPNKLAILTPFGGEWLLDYPLLWPEVGQYGFSWSPDGTKIAYYKTLNEQQGSVQVVSLTDGQIYRLNTFDFQSQFAYYGEKPYWSADNQYVIYSNDAAPAGFVMARWDGTELWQVQKAEGLPGNPGDLQELFWSADLHTLIAYGGSNMGGTSGIWQFTFSDDLHTIVEMGIADYIGELMGWVEPGFTVLTRLYDHEINRSTTSIIPLTSLTVLPTPTFPPQPTPYPTAPLPTLAPDAPPIDVWIGIPVYQGESNPPLVYQVEFETGKWAIAEHSVFHRVIPHCTITPIGGMGLAWPLSVESSSKQLGDHHFSISAIKHETWGIVAVDYFTDVADSYTGFRINFYDQQSACITDAEVVLTTLQSIPNPAITPTP